MNFPTHFMTAITHTFSTPGRLIYLMGPSGSGKDSLLQAARPVLQARGCPIASRVITRPADDDLSQEVTEAEFQRLVRQGAFAMHWQANGHHYGISRRINDCLQAGQDVLVNGSRGYLSQARQRYPTLLAIVLVVDDDILRQRLTQRGREPRSVIDARLRRNALFADGLAHPCYYLDNSGSLQQAVDQLLTLLNSPDQMALDHTAA